MIFENDTDCQLAYTNSLSIVFFFQVLSPKFLFRRPFLELVRYYCKIIVITNLIVIVDLLYFESRNRFAKGNKRGFSHNRTSVFITVILK